MCQTAMSLGEALRLAGSAVGRGDLICITGSFYLIGEAKIRFKPHSTSVRQKNLRILTLKLALFGFALIASQGVLFLHNPLSKLTLP